MTAFSYSLIWCHSNKEFCFSSIWESVCCIQLSKESLELIKHVYPKTLSCLVTAIPWELDTPFQNYQECLCIYFILQNTLFSGMISQASWEAILAKILANIRSVDHYFHLWHVRVLFGMWDLQRPWGVPLCIWGTLCPLWELWPTDSCRAR